MLIQKKEKEFEMSFREFLAKRYPQITGKIENGEVISCPSLEDFLAYIANTKVIDISAVDFSENQPIVIENRAFVSFTAENADYEGGITLKSVTVVGDISFHGSYVEKIFCLQKIKTTNLFFPENITGSEVALSNITATGEIDLPEHA